MDVAGLLEQGSAIAVRIVHALDRLLDAVDRVLGQLQCDVRMFACGELGDGIQRHTYAVGPACRRTVVDESSGARGAIDDAPQARLDGLAVALDRRRGEVELAEQLRVMLGEIHDHVDQDIDALGLQMRPDPAEGADAIDLAVVRSVGQSFIGGERCRHHVLAEPPIRESGAGALSADLVAAAGKDGAIVVAAGDLGQHTLRLERKDLDLPIGVIIFAALEDLVAGELAESRDVEAGPRARSWCSGPSCRRL